MRGEPINASPRSPHACFRLPEKRENICITPALQAKQILYIQADKSGFFFLF